MHHPPDLQALFPPKETTHRLQALRETIRRRPALQETIHHRQALQATIHSPRLIIPHHPVHREHMANPHTTSHPVHQAAMDMALAHLSATLQMGLPCLRRRISTTAPRCKARITKYNNHSSNIHNAQGRRERFASVLTTSVSPHNWLAVSTTRTT